MTVAEFDNIAITSILAAIKATEAAIKDAERNILRAITMLRLQDEALSTASQAISQLLASALSRHSVKSIDKVSTGTRFKQFAADMEAFSRRKIITSSESLRRPSSLKPVAPRRGRNLAANQVRSNDVLKRNTRQSAKRKRRGAS